MTLLTPEQKTRYVVEGVLNWLSPHSAPHRKEEATQQLLTLLNEEKIKELKSHIIWDGDNVGGISMSRIQVDDRLQALKQGEKR